MKEKRWLCLLLAAVLLCSGLSGTTVYAQDTVNVKGESYWDREDAHYGNYVYYVGKQRQFRYDIKRDGTVEIVRYERFGSITHTPAKIKGRKVTSIGRHAYEDNPAKEIIIPKWVKEIGGSAFLGCKNLKKITIPKRVKTIGSDAFDGCSSLKKITIPKGVKTIGSGAFSGCKRLEKIAIPKGVETIGAWTFFGCTNLKKITIPKSVNTIGRMAFYSCTSLKKITIPKGVKYIEGQAFKDCTSLKKITISKGVKEIGDEAFEGCRNLVNVSLSEGLQSIGDRAFIYCDKIKRFKVPRGVTYIGDEVFKTGYWSAAMVIMIPKSVKEFGMNGGQDLFTGRSGVEIFYEGSERQWNGIGYGSLGGGNRNRGNKIRIPVHFNASYLWK